MGCCDLGEKGEKNPQKRAMSEKIDAIGWAIFFIMIGALLLLPDSKIPDTAWLLGVGVIILGGNAARKLFSIKIEASGVILGLIALAIGIGGFIGLEVPVFPILIIIVGMHILFGVLHKKKA